MEMFFYLPFCIFSIFIQCGHGKITQKLQCCPQTCPKCIPLQYRKIGNKELLSVGDEVQIRRRLRGGKDLKAGFGELLQLSDDRDGRIPRPIELFDPYDIYQQRFMEQIDNNSCDRDCACSNCVCCFTETILCTTTETCAAVIFDTILETITKTTQRTLTTISSVTAKIIFTLTNAVFFTSTITTTSTFETPVYEFSFTPATIVSVGTLYARTVLTVDPANPRTFVTSFFPEVTTTLRFTLTSTVYVSLIPSYVNATATTTVPGFTTEFYPGTIIKKKSTATINVEQTFSTTETLTTLVTQYPEEFFTEVYHRTFTETFTDTISKCIGVETIRYTPVRTIVKRKGTSLPLNFPCCPRHGCGVKCDC